MRFPILCSLGAVLLTASVATAGPVGTDLMNKPLKVRWSAQAGKDAGPVDMLSTGERLIAVSWSGELYAFDAATGKRVWKKKPRKPHDYEHGEIALAGGVVVWRNAEDTQLLGLDPQTGRQKWAIELEAPASRLTTCEGSRLVVVSHRGADGAGKGTLLARAIDPIDGTTRWRTPVPSELAGDGGGSVFAYRLSGRGRLFNGLTAVSCATGEARTLTFPVKKPYLTFLDAGGDTLATAHGIHGGSFTEVCMTSIKNPNNVTCTAIEGSQSVDGGLVQADIDRLYVSSTGALIAYDLETKKAVGRSTPGNAGVSPANAGAVLLSAVGGTGMDDFAFLLDPVDMRRVGTVALSKAPTQLVADSKMGYVAAYDGSIKAFELPLPGPKPLLEEVVQVSTSASPGVEQVEDLGWQVSSIINAHPKKGRSSGTRGDGTVDAVAWLGDTGRLAVGGNDDKGNEHSIGAFESVDVRSDRSRRSITFGVDTAACRTVVPASHPAARGYRLHKDAESGAAYSTAGKSLVYDEGRRVLVAKQS
ncbi:MAG: PQQ-like beta-propeller repeat protein, partial [Phycisphaerales bacterium]|nr:PQQ-like beta-propeller repeat protein [Phycisphaerales bacterium]